MVNQPIPSKDIVSQLSRLAFRVGLPIGTLQVSRPWNMAIRLFKGFSVVTSEHAQPEEPKNVSSFIELSLSHAGSRRFDFLGVYQSLDIDEEHR